MFSRGVSPGGYGPPSASPSGSNNTATGRPPLWTRSTLRQMSRLYVYTTLPLDKIMAVVHAKSSDAGPGLDSGNKKLASLFDKQPRWLKPRDKEDMGRRLDELSLSQTRSTSRGSWTSRSSRSHSVSDPMTLLDPSNSQSFAYPVGTSPTNLSVPPFNHFPPPEQHAPRRTSKTATTPVQAVPLAKQEEDQSMFRRFLRQSTFMSSSTDCTTGSLHRVLGDYSESYVKSVKRLIKRYTVPINRGSGDLSPISGEDEPETTWYNDQDMPPSLPIAPYHLPGDFLNLDVDIHNHPACFQRTEEHFRRACWCFAGADIQKDVWTTARGLSTVAQQIIQHGIEPDHISHTDCFGNTILHFLSARGAPEQLLKSIQSGWSVGLTNASNSAGQTVLHVLHPIWFRNKHALSRLLLALRQKKFNFNALDHYGRAFSHILYANDISRDFINWYLQKCISGDEQKRDAFNVKPVIVPSEPNVGITRADTQMMDLDPPIFETLYAAHEDPIVKEARLVEFVREAQLKPHMEDSEGRNGLHCLAAAILSSSSLLQKHSLDEEGTPTNRRPRKDKMPKDLDSCTERLQRRQEFFEGLLEAGVDPNHYDARGNTPLMAFAAQLPENDDYTVGPQILHRLIEAGAQINARNRAGETALHIAVRCGRKRAVQQLVKDCANVYVRDAAGRSVLEVADVKMKGLKGHDTDKYAHLEACRAWLSGMKGLAVQEPTVVQEWNLDGRGL